VDVSEGLVLDPGEEEPGSPAVLRVGMGVVGGLFVGVRLGDPDGDWRTAEGVWDGLGEGFVEELVPVDEGAPGGFVGLFVGVGTVVSDGLGDGFAEGTVAVEEGPPGVVVGLVGGTVAVGEGVPDDGFVEGVGKTGDGVSVGLDPVVVGGFVALGDGVWGGFVVGVTSGGFEAGFEDGVWGGVGAGREVVSEGLGVVKVGVPDGLDVGFGKVGGGVWRVVKDGVPDGPNVGFGEEKEGVSDGPEGLVSEGVEVGFGRVEEGVAEGLGELEDVEGLVGEGATEGLNNGLGDGGLGGENEVVVGGAVDEVGVRDGVPAAF
jgi:hypothetical protein